MEAFSWLGTLLLVLASGALCWLLGWIIARAERRLAQRLSPPAAEPEAAAEANQSLRRLLIAWGAKGLRTLIWVLYFIFLLNLLPQTRPQVLSVRERLMLMFDRLADWLLGRGVNALVVVVVTIFLMRFVAALITTGFELFERRAGGEGTERMRRRSKTLSNIFRGVAQAVILFVGLMVLLQQLGLNITPILASAGIVGIAVGFGAQSLVRDIFAGFLILLEDQYGVGDVIKIGEAAGIVEHLTLRSTRVRGVDGSLTTIPNGSITSVSNLSREWSRAVLDVEVDYSEDVDRAMQVMMATAQQMKEEMPREVLDEPAMLGVDRLTGSSVVLRLTVKTAPAKQAEIGRELRRRLKLAFDREGIRVPSGQQQLILATETGRQGDGATGRQGEKDSARR
jgi:small conductance mechanosensitive channel